MSPGPTKILDKVAEDCEQLRVGSQAGFVALWRAAEKFALAAKAFEKLEQDQEFKDEFERWVSLLSTFTCVLNDAIAMGLLDVPDATSRPSTAKTLDKLLGTAARRSVAIYSVYRFADAAVCCIGINMHPHLLSPWAQACQAILTDTRFLACFGSIDAMEWHKRLDQIENQFLEITNAYDCEFIDIFGAVDKLMWEAAENLIRSLKPAERSHALDVSTARLARLVSFLTLPEQERWIISCFRTINAADSLQAILKAVQKNDIVPLAPTERFIRQISEAGLPRLPGIGTYFSFEARRPRREYIVSTLPLNFWVERMSVSAADQMSRDPTTFLRQNFEKIPVSSGVIRKKALQMEVERYSAGTKFTELNMELGSDLAITSFVCALLNWAQAPDGTTDIVVPLLAGLVRIIKKFEQKTGAR